MIFAVCTGLFISSMWLICHWYYQRIYGHKLRWWAIPLSHGALLFGERLERWEDVG